MIRPNRFNQATERSQDEDVEPLLEPLPDESEEDFEESTGLRKTPLPIRQLSIILFAQFLQTLLPQVINPFLPQLIRDTGITKGDETRVGYYAGILSSAYYFTQAISTIYWSRISDLSGRKPILLFGLGGTCISMLWFGLTMDFWSLFVSRIVCGLIGGNSALVKTLIAEVCDKTNIGRTYALLPITWAVGNMLGSLLGGYLSRPAMQYPDWFGNVTFFHNYPYFLPCVVPAILAIVAATVAMSGLDETVEHPLPLLSSLKILVGVSKPPRRWDYTAVNQEAAGSAGIPLPVIQLFIPKVLVAVSCHSLLSAADLAYQALKPLFYSTPINLGGLGLPPVSIGHILFAGGISSSVFMLVCFPRIYDRWGPKRLYIAGLTFLVPGFSMFPLIGWVARSRGSIDLVVWSLIGLQALLSVGVGMGFGTIFILLAASSPNKASLGVTNGLSQTVASFSKAVGPALASSLFSLSIERHWFGGNFVYGFFVATTLLLCHIATYLEE